MASLSFKDLRKSYGKVEIVKGFNLDMGDGEFVVLLGASGCGKSTILRMVAGLETITSGDISMGEKCLNTVDPKDRDLAMVFQSYALYPHMTVYENIAFGLKMQGKNKLEIKKSVDWAAEMLQLTDYLDRRPKQLSGGQRQRVAMGRAMVRTPKLFLFDEPLSNLDAKLRGKMRAEIKDMHHKLGVTTLYVTHDQVEAMTLADRIVVMNKGITAQIGTPYEVFTQPANKFVASFIGSPTMNMIPATVNQEQEGWTLSLSDQKIDLPAKFLGKVTNGQAVTLGVRPNDIHLHQHQLEAGHGIEAKCKLIDHELLGATMLIKAELGGEQIIIETPAEHGSLEGAINVYLDSQFLHMFDIESQLSLA
ncbi:ABC transporter ATP-binding protein [Agarivorans sp. MS3-6]|uniref:ABC transporter ATP-binding protein n=1 Tax=Agarivorans sp. TSD2052 TaxID=2937286 RepID=UPI00200F6FBE|nr:sn-glycerol-3-phosphate ABC transporter ATP-binding protein UgpC [Agarivorans sp. TSD2052]UPW18924.1 sn-glycerol-3-phosphate ABC transporter ATP-binding protein UgpC [Agarivorans sp. TSD2052]